MIDDRYEFPWQNGLLLPTDECLKKEALLKFMTQEDEENEAMWAQVFELGLMEEENWQVLDTAGKTTHFITPPAIDNCWFIEWRFIQQ
ncbi:hypothetical protein SAMN06265795_1281 [Noviherbaspirillum humi]|uniref:Uncharacterized protein n=1 Tax=Noviherbaspirillum humi TaxID=1688639 RepID=A0A239LZ11_9BURK|nr:hypothetical protein [Noviherbaspirillum humi]SNT35202.1 hypothetical protein SAMN06265795_1281 [Noviherbaspirillum humi]